MEPNRDSRQTETGRISFEEWTRITAASAPHLDERGLTRAQRRHVRRPMVPFVPVTATLCAAGAVVAAVMIWF